MKFYFTILIYCGLFFIFQASGKVSMIGSTKVNRGWNKHDWVLSSPSACSVTCGDGVQMSVYECRHTKNRNLVPPFYCLHTQLPDTVYNACIIQACKPVWLVSDWSRCNATCGFGMKTRSVKCGMKIHDGQPSFVQDHYCPNLRPVEHKTCNDKICPHWRTGKWSKCSVSCGQGLSWRKIHCISADQSPCPISRIPKTKKICYQGLCLVIDAKPKEESENEYSNEKKSLPEENEIDEDFDGEVKIVLYDLEEKTNTNLILGGDQEIDNSKEQYPDYGIEFRKRFNGGDPRAEKENQTNTVETDQHQANQTSTTPSSRRSDEGNKDARIKNYRYMQHMPCDDCSISLVIADDESIVYLLTNSSVNLICNDEDDSTIWYHNEAVISKNQGYKLRRVTSVDSGIYICFRKSRVSKVAVAVFDDVIGMQHLQKESEDKFMIPEEPIDIVPNSDFNQQFTIRLGVAYPPPYTLNNFFVEQQVICYVSTNLFFMYLDVSLCDEERASIVPFISSDVPTYEWQHTDWSNCSEECAGNGVGRREREVWCQSPGDHRVDENHCISAGLELEASVIPCPKTDCIAYWKAHQYSECNGVCGRFGIRARKVECTVGADLVVQESLCETHEKPAENIQCRLDCDLADAELCIDKDECKKIEAAERCNDWNIEYCCQTCNTSNVF